MIQYCTYIQSPVGKIKLLATDKGMRALVWQDSEESPAHREVVLLPNFILEEAEYQLREYFSGRLKKFNLPLDVEGTEFQKKVWGALATIPYGETRSYAALAKTIGNPKAFRAVGGANNKNPVGIIVPCHRVIGIKGDLIGFAGGLTVKKKLLALESKFARKY